MRRLKVFLFLTIFVLVAGSLIFSADSKVRVTAAQANIRLRPTTQSEILARVPLGAMLDVIKKEGEWYFVKLPPDAQGLVVTGYIHQSIVEVFQASEEVKKAEERIEQVKKVEESKPAEQFTEKLVFKVPTSDMQSSLKGKPLSEKEKHFLATDPYYPTWREKLDQAKEEQKSAKRWIWIGAGGMGVGYLVMPILGALVFTASESPGGSKSADTITTIGLLGVGTAGLATMIYGFVQHSSKGRKVGKILEEGMIKGYILGLNIDPQNKLYGITLAYRF